jgi:hypothetical protein
MHCLQFWFSGAQDIRTGSVRSPEINRLEVRGSETNARFSKRRGSGWEAEGNEEGPEDERKAHPATAGSRISSLCHVETKHNGFTGN